MEWRWLVPGQVNLLGISTFGELIIRDEMDQVFILDIHEGRLQKLTEAQDSFWDNPSLENIFKETELHELQSKGWKLRELECFTYTMPIVVKEGPHKLCTMNVYEAVGFLGDFHRQVKDLPDGAKIQLKVTE